MKLIIVSVILMISAVLSSEPIQRVLAARDRCFTSRTYRTGSEFRAPRPGRIIGVELVYKRGSTTCRRGGTPTNWGCDNDKLMVQLVKTGGQTLYPTSGTAGCTINRPARNCARCNVWVYSVNGFNTKSPNLKLMGPPRQVTAGESFSLQNGEGCCNIHTGDNSGTVWADVYFYYQRAPPPTGRPTPRPANYYAAQSVAGIVAYDDDIDDDDFEDLVDGEYPPMEYKPAMPTVQSPSNYMVLAASLAILVLAVSATTYICMATCNLKQNTANRKIVETYE